MATEAKPIQTVTVEPAQDRDISSSRPTETRYGWCPYADINLVGPDGTPTLYVQPHKIDAGSGSADNPYHRVLPKSQLIAFPTFAAVENVLSPDIVDSQGRAVTVQGTRTITSLEAATMVLRNYSFWGFVILNSLQGLEQEQAMRIFRVVQPLGYLLADLENELTFGALERIDAVVPIKFADDYVVEPLQTDYERSTARQLAAEMTDGASIAFLLATTTLDDTEASMVQRHSGGQGKTGPDPNDVRLAGQLRRELPKLVGTDKQNDISGLREQMNFLVGREASRADKERIAELEAKIAKMEGAGVLAQDETPVKETKEPKLSALKAGDKVTVDGREATVTKRIFNNYTVQFAEGDSVTLRREKLGTQ